MGGVKRVALLGSTGSIGRQTLDIIRAHPDRLKVVGLTANSSAEVIQRQAQEFGVSRVALMNEAAAHRSGLPGGMSAVVDAATADDVDIVVVAVAGVIGLLPTMAAIEAGKDIALASKEVLVAAGPSVMPRIREKGVKLTPIDSEHSAIFQCLEGHPASHVNRLILTASGGPFLGRSRESLASVTQEQALNHPTWKMGGKITVDSATLMNKGLEVIEARWLFDVPISRIGVVIHPQSIIHSMVEFTDTSVLAQMGWPDMRLPIQYALLHPDRPSGGLKPWSPLATPQITFQDPDSRTFRCLYLAKQAGAAEGTMPCVMNAANEEAANGFLKGQCGFLQIADIVEEVMSQHTPVEPTLEAVLELDAWARSAAQRLMQAE